MAKSHHFRHFGKKLKTRKTRKIKKSCRCIKGLKMFQFGGQYAMATPLQGPTNSVGGQFIDIKGGQYFKNPVGGIAGGGRKRKTYKRRH